MKKQYKVGDRIFFECLDGSIETAIIIKVTKEFYLDDKGKQIPYLQLTTWESEDGRISCGIEDYNCLSENDPRCKELVTKYKKFDDQREEIINAILEIMSPWETEIQSEIIDLLKIKLNI